MKTTTQAILSLFFAAVFSAVLPSVAFAQTDERRGVYVSPEVGIAKLSDYCDGLDEDREESCDDSVFGFGMSGGYWLNEFFAVEGGFRLANGLGVVGRDFEGTSADLTDDIISSVETDFFSWSLGVRGSFPLGEKFAIGGKVGAHFWDAESDIRFTDNDGSPTVINLVSGGSATRASADEDGTDLYFGIGGEYRFTDHIAVRAEYTRYKADNDADLISGSFVWNF